MKRFAVLVALCVAFFRFPAASDVLFDDFMNRFTGGPTLGDVSQTELGEAYGFVKYTDSTVDLGGGFWQIGHDPFGTKITNGAGDSLSADSSLTVKETAIDPVSNKRVLHLIFHPERAVRADFNNDWPYAELQGDFPGDSNKYFDLSKLTAIKFKVKGVANKPTRFSVLTKKVMAFGDTAWGYHGMFFTPTADWQWITITVADLLPDAGGPAHAMKWDSVKTECKGFLIEAGTGDTKATNKDSTDLYLDSVIIQGMDYADFGFTYSPMSIRNGLRIAANPDFMLQASAGANALDIKYSLKKAGDVAIDLFNSNGKKVMNLAKGFVAANNTVTKSFSTSTLSAGAYFVRISANGATVSKEVSIVK
jgi:hypothetical protein